MDYFLYNGEIARFSDLDFINFIAAEKAADDVTLILVTPGGSPDAAYKIGKYLQARYSTITMLIPGFCKSAGTLLAIAADNLVFTAYGELGPLDVQMVKTDHLASMDSGLNISEAFLTLESRAREQFHGLISEIIVGSGGVVSFQTASHSAAEMVSSLYGPIFGKMDPEEVGSRARAMRIGEDYARRLNRKYKNLKDKSIESLSRSYSSHAFVIDREEASLLFEKVREASDTEKAAIEKMGLICRFPHSEVTFQNVTAIFNAEMEQPHDASGEQKVDTGYAKGNAPESKDAGTTARPNGAASRNTETADGAERSPT